MSEESFVPTKVFLQYRELPEDRVYMKGRHDV